MAFVLRYLTRTEERLGPLTQLVSVAGWAVRRLKRYTTFAANITIIVPAAAEAALVVDAAAHLKLRALVVDLQQYQVTWESGVNPWEAETAEQLVVDWQDPLPGMEPPHVTHVDTYLSMPEAQ